jgi:hypothetical protein
MSSVESDLPAWIDAVVTIAYRWKEPGKTVRGLFEDARPDLSDRRAFETSVADRLARESGLIETWQAYSWDKRTSPSPYMNGLEVGFFDEVRRDVIKHRDA